MTPNSTDRVFAARVFREEAEREGFARSGIARAETPPGFDRYRRWIAEGHHAGMRYLEESASVRESPESLLPGARSVLCLAAAHAPEPCVGRDGSRIARYAAGPDYHGTLRERATRVAERLAARVAVPVAWRVCVDSTPLAERSFAAAAGLGWVGKNGCLIDAELGSFFLLAEILTDLDLPPDDPVAERCGSCVRCLEACPTGAFIEPGLLDANRCLAYWTIEHRGAIPDAVKDFLGERVFGCDDCQDACPWNASLGSGRTAAVPGREDWIAMGRGEFRRAFGATALNRAGWRGMQRNAALSAGCEGDAGLSGRLKSAAGCGDRGLSDASRWALSRLPSFESPGAESGG
ncbi:MAG: tRNA epoxyqueuosine(34) reductase QueG [Thermoanaerobaculia bacterium]|nr:tRNA epoxyqueuosine(34) reductase QueG [Acidobacteriota bacterium]